MLPKKIIALPIPYNIEFKCVGRLIFDINYVECYNTFNTVGIIWHNSKEQYHRENGPAVIWDDGAQHWYRYDERHREDGPANGWKDGEQFWWLNNIQYSEEEVNEEIRRRDELRKCKNPTNAS